MSEQFVSISGCDVQCDDMFNIECKIEDQIYEYEVYKVLVIIDEVFFQYLIVVLFSVSFFFICINSRRFRFDGVYFCFCSSGSVFYLFSCSSVGIVILSIYEIFGENC